MTDRAGLLARKLWDDNTAKKVGWTLSLFPTLVLYSVLPLREVYACFFLLLAIFGVVNWVRDDSLKSIGLASFGFIGGTCFHAFELSSVGPFFGVANIPRWRAGSQGLKIGMVENARVQGVQGVPLE